MNLAIDANWTGVIYAKPKRNSWPHTLTFIIAPNIVDYIIRYSWNPAARLSPPIYACAHETVCPNVFLHIFILIKTPSRHPFAGQTMANATTIKEQQMVSSQYIYNVHGMIISGVIETQLCIAKRNTHLHLYSNSNSRLFEITYTQFHNNMTVVVKNSTLITLCQLCFVFVLLFYFILFCHHSQSAMIQS